MKRRVEFKISLRDPKDVKIFSKLFQIENMLWKWGREGVLEL